MALAHARDFVLRMSEYAFEPHVDADECDVYAYPGELELECLGRFRAGHPECPGDVLGARWAEGWMAERPQALSLASYRSRPRALSDPIPLDHAVSHTRDSRQPDRPHQRLRRPSRVDKACLVLSFVSVAVVTASLAALACYFLWKMVSLVAAGFVEMWRLAGAIATCRSSTGLAGWRECIAVMLGRRASDGPKP